MPTQSHCQPRRSSHHCMSSRVASLSSTRTIILLHLLYHFSSAARKLGLCNQRYYPRKNPPEVSSPDLLCRPPRIMQRTTPSISTIALMAGEAQASRACPTFPGKRSSLASPDSRMMDMSPKHARQSAYVDPPELRTLPLHLAPVTSVVFASQAHITSTSPCRTFRHQGQSTPRQPEAFDLHNWPACSERQTRPIMQHGAVEIAYTHVTRERSIREVVEN
jgi:hypothetical protein